MNKINKDFFEYVKKATSPFHVVEEGCNLLKKNDFVELSLGERWKLKKGGKYFVRVYGTSLFSFVIGKNYKEAGRLHVASAHTDYPCFRIKPSATIKDKGYIKLDVESYGGAIINSWLDRPLSIAGKVTYATKDIYHPGTALIDLKRPVLTIPNLAIHMNRDVNKGYEFNKQTELLPILSMIKDKMSEGDYLKNIIAKEAKINVTDILDYDLYIYNAEEPCYIGADKDFISSPRLDNLTSCYVLLKSISSMEVSKSNKLGIIALFDNEEVGSRSNKGADSLIAKMILEKIYEGLGFDNNSLNASILNDSLALSLDVAHGYHPNFPSKYDPNNICPLNSGLVIKLNYSQKYATDSEAIAIVEGLCRANSIKYQKFVNRSDIAGGGTLGSIMQSYLPMPTVDMGVGLLAMHSARELMGAEDLERLADLVFCFFN